MAEKVRHIMLLSKAAITKGDGFLKQAVLSLIIVMLAAGVLLALFLYTLWMIRAAQLQILLGELCILWPGYVL